MDVRSAESNDRNRIREIAGDSLRSSYSLSPQQIETILTEEFDDTSLNDLLNDPDTTVLVVDETIDGTKTVYGFITVQIGTRATIRWLHVDPEARGRGIATALLDRVHEEFVEKSITACILDEAVEGSDFLKGFGLKESDHDQITIGGEEFDVTMFTGGQKTSTPNEPAVPIPEFVTIGGIARLVNHDESVPGREAPFFQTYRTEDEEDAYGYFCSQCGSTDVSADGQDRLECGNCGNSHLADDWDDAYL